MIKVYGIKTCGSFKKGINYFKSNNIEVKTFNLKEVVPSKEELKELLKKAASGEIKIYRELDLKNK